MTFTVFACETVTGTNLGPVDLEIQSWTRVLNGAETASFQLNLDSDSGLNPSTRDWYRLITTPARATLVIDWDGIPIWAGPVINRQQAGSGAITINASGLLWLLARRKLADPASATAIGSQVFTFAGDYGYIAQQLVAATLARAGGSLPITLPGYSPGTDHTLNYNGSDLSTISDLLSNLSGLVNGPDIDFSPYWIDANRTAICWRMITGTATAPKITSGNQLSWDLSQPGGGVQTVQATDDAASMATTDWAKGATPDPVTTTDGAGNSTTVDQPPLISVAQSTAYTALGWPLLETENDYSTVSIQATLDAHAAGDLATYPAPTEQWTITVDALEDPRLGTYQLGDLPTVRVAGHAWIPDGVYGMRILQVNGSNGTAVTLTMQTSNGRGLHILGSPDQSLPARVKRLERLSPFT